MPEYKERFCMWCRRYREDKGFIQIRNGKGRPAGMQCPVCQEARAPGGAVNKETGK